MAEPAKIHVHEETAAPGAEARYRETPEKGKEKMPPLHKEYRKEREATTSAQQPEEMRTLWKLHKKDKPNKPLRMRMGEKYQEFEIKNIGPGNYALVLQTIDYMKYGGEAGPRFIAADVMLKDAQYNILLRDIYRIHGQAPTCFVEFGVPESRAPASLFLHLQCHSPFPLGMKITGKLMTAYKSHTKSIFQDFNTPYDERLTKGIKREDIDRELRRDSKWKQKAYDAALIRPFLWLAAMHPLTRQHIADLLNLKLQKTRNYGDAHYEAWKILAHKRHGLRFYTQHSFETANVAHEPSWHTMVKRALAEVYPQEHAVEDIATLAIDDAKKVSNDPDSKAMHDLEDEFLCQISKTHHKQLKKRDKKDPGYNLVETTNRLIHGLEVRNIFANMNQNRLRDPKIQRLLVELVVMNHYQYLKDEKNRDEFRQRIIKKERKIVHKDKHAKHDVPDKIVPEYSYDLSDKSVLRGLKQLLTHGKFDPRTKTQKSWEYGEEAGKFVGFQALKYGASLAFPPIGLPLTILGIVHYFVKANHRVTFLAILQIMLFKVFLAAYGMNVDNYYSYRTPEKKID